jgi:serine/threonine protein kinase/WD40 repeat protein
MNEDSIFVGALQIPEPAARAAFLDRACADNTDLRQSVELLLKAHEKAGGFMQPGPKQTATIDQPVSEHPGTVIGPYKLLEKIGEGGFGVVFMAEQTQPVRRKVAIKILKLGMDTRDVVARFEAERQALAIMDHPNIAKVLDGGSAPSGRPFFVMELVKGTPITDFCDQHHLTPRQRLELFVSVCQAVQHAHQKGIIHRDLKPSNVLVTVHDTTPVVKVIDFGVAKALGHELTDKTLFTGFAQMIGTPLYMSPEQAGQSGLDVDTRRDIYSLGVLLYELLTGTTPFTKERFQKAAYDEIRRIIREEDPPRPSTRLSDLGRSGDPTRTGAAGHSSSLASVSASRTTEPAKLTRLFRGEVDWIVMKALEKDRGRRYETANGFAADVQRYLAGEAVMAVPPSVGYRFRKFARRNRGPVLAASLVVLALLVGIVGTTLGMIRATRAEAGAVEEAGKKEIALKDKETALAAAQRSKRDADEKLFESYTDQARAFRTSRRPGQRFESLDALQRATDLARRLDLPAAKFHELRNAVIASLALPDLHLTGPWHPWPADGYSVDFDEALALCARTDRRGNCSVRRMADDAELYSLPGLGAPAVPHLSRDGKFLAVQHFRKGPPQILGGGVQLWALDGAAARLIRSEEQGFSVDFHPNGRQVGLTDNDGTIHLLELPGGRPVGNPLAPDTLRLANIALHPTEPLVAVCSYDARVVQIRDVRTGQVVASLPQTAGAIHIAWRPDGRTLAVGFADPDLIRLYDRTTLQLVQTLDCGGVDFSFNPAGDRLVGCSWGAAYGLIDVNTGQKLFVSPMGIVSRHFSRDGRRLGGGVWDGRLGTCQVGDGREYRILVRKAPPAKVKYQCSALHPAGRLLAVGMADGLGLWDLATGSELAFQKIDEGSDGVTDVRFEPSGALLTAGYSGLMRWPVRADPQTPDRLRVGPAERLLPRANILGQSQDPGGRVIVACNRAVGRWQAFAGGWILHADRPGEPIPLDAGADISWIAVSPDGRWVVTATHFEGRAKVWDARDGRLVKKLIDFGADYPRFSPDGKWLSTSADGGRVFAVGTWEPGPQVGIGGVFAPDSRLMALYLHVGAIDLVDRVTGREIARLEDPNFCSTNTAFTPDGVRLIGQLAAGSDLSKGIVVWNPRLLREHLKKMDLDWDYPEFPPPAEEAQPAAPLRAEILPGDAGKPALTREQEARQSIAQNRRRVDANPDDAEAANSLAWWYLIAPESLRDAKAALPLAEKAVRLKPGEAMYRNTLGLAYYRTGRFREAVATLRPNLDTQEKWGLAFDLYFLAMSHHRLGETARARVYYDWAVRWPPTDPRLKPGILQELDLFRVEAADLLGIEAKKD